MKKTVMFGFVIALLVAIGMVETAWAPEPMPKVYQPIPIKPILYHKKVFLSSQAYVGNLNGLAGADQLCQRLASAAGLSGTYKAWLCDGKGAGPSTRFNKTTGPISLRNGVVVANSMADILRTGQLLNRIDFDEYGKEIILNPSDPYGPIPVWTGQQPPVGTSMDPFPWNYVLQSPTFGACNGWATSWSGSYAFVTDANTYPSFSLWMPIQASGFPGGIMNCDKPMGRLYCFEQ